VTWWEHDAAALTTYLNLLQVLSNSAECHEHSSNCPRRPPGASGFFPGNERWIQAVRAMMCLHSLHIFLWGIAEDDFRQVYEALLPTLSQLRINTFCKDVIRRIYVGDEIVELAGWPWQLPALMSPPQSIFQWAPDAGVVWPPMYVQRPAILPIIEPPPLAPHHPHDLPVRAVRERAAQLLLRARLLYVRCYTRYSNSFWVYAMNRIGLIRMG